MRSATDLLDELNAVDESARIEAKRASDTGKSVMETVIAFANEPGLDGGYLLLDSIWGICLKGTPFIRLPGTATNKQAVSFAGLRVRGRICYYTYEVEKTEMIEIAAYNPLTGRPFRKGSIPRKVSAVQEKILHFEDGRRSTFSQEGFLEWIEDDQQLWRTVADLSDEEVQEKLYKCLLIYDDRNPVYVPARE